MSFLPGTLYTFSTRVDAERYTATIDVPLVVAVHDFDTRSWSRDTATGGAWRLALAVSRTMSAHDVVTSVQRDGSEITFYFSGDDVNGALCMTLPLDDSGLELVDALTSSALDELRRDRHSLFVRARCS